MAFLKPSCRTFSCGPGATPKPGPGSLSTAVTESACCSCHPSTVPQQGSGDLLCASCPAGTEPRHETCQPCPAGRYATAGSETCQPCGAGHVPNANLSDCVRCPHGTYSDLGQCAACVFPLYLQDDTCILPHFLWFFVPFFSLYQYHMQFMKFKHLFASIILKTI